jgi:hypothetical protein
MTFYYKQAAPTALEKTLFNDPISIQAAPKAQCDVTPV